ncbi:phosphatase PAP2 family protein [Christiangramia sabulilitoris]|uniref:Phosphatase PAP2 family protein n=1 Tax=Christiangramia sabulilitoris TaxID=2583991 RepID=A0A550I297_9FLAO|nr:phosphatase PAP2 family protein [Christiangramia sabulilitoris]TRO65087.1 phosphatase PAP2 family protein [Christiangramia sabulilitoris]
MKKIALLLLVFFISSNFYAQESTSPYKTDFWKDGSWIAGSTAMNVLGVITIQNKENLTDAELIELDKNDLWKINRGAAGNYSVNADELSYIPFYASFASPLLFLLNEGERKNFGQISVMFIETMATTGAFFTITAGTVQKSRPLVYNESLSNEERADSDAQRSFFAGHTAATAAATFFSAKVYQDYHPESPAVPFVWAGAVAVPAYVGYLRTKAGKHFLTDNIVGFGIGAACGILVPEIHKIGNEKLDIYPTAQTNVMGTGVDTKGIGMSYSF